MDMKRMLPIFFISGLVLGCSDQIIEPEEVFLPQFSLGATAAPSLAATILVGGPGDQRGLAVSTDASAVYTAGANAPHGLLVKFGIPPAGPVWTKVEPRAYLKALALSEGVVYAIGDVWPGYCGASDGRGGTEAKTLLARYDASGSLLNCRSENYFPYRGYEWYEAALAVPPFVYAAGYAEQYGWARKLPFVLARYDAAGNYMTAVTEPFVGLGTRSTPPWDYGESAVFGLAELGGDLYLAGFSRLWGVGEDNIKRPTLMRYSGSLVRVWKVRPIDNAGGWFRDVAVLGGHLYAVGENGTSPSRDFLVEKYNPAGGRIWSVTSGGGGDDVLQDVVAVGGRLFAVGHTTSSGAGGADGVVLEIDPSKGSLKNNFRISSSVEGGVDGVVAIGLDLVGIEVEPLHLAIGDPDALGVLFLHQVSAHGEAGGGAGGTKVLQDQLIAFEGAALPVLADLAEEAVLDGVPLRGTGRVVADGDDELVDVAEAGLEPVLEGAAAGAVAAASVCEDQEVGGVRIGVLSFPFPPAGEVVGREVGGVVGGAHEDGAPVGEEVVDPVGDGLAEGVGGEVVVAHQNRFARPRAARVPEVSDQLLLLGVDAHDGLPIEGEALAALGDVGELLVAVRPRAARQLLVVDPEGEVQLPEEPGHRVGADLDTQSTQLGGDLLRGSACPLEPRARVAGDLVLQELLDSSDHVGRFFSTLLRPPPSRRTRPTSTSCSISSRLPRATVAGSSPRSSAIFWSPP